MKAGSIAVWMFLLKGCFLIRFWVQPLEIMLAPRLCIKQQPCWQTLATYSCTDDNMKTVIVWREETRKIIQDENNQKLLSNIVIHLT